MTPGKRLDQIEPVIGDILKTQDEHTAQNKEILLRQDEHAGQIRELTRLVIDLSVAQSRTKKELSERMDGFNERMDGFNERMDGFNERMDGFGERMDGFGERMDRLDGRIDRLDGRIDKLELGQTDLTMKVDLILKILQDRN